MKYCMGCTDDTYTLDGNRNEVLLHLVTEGRRGRILTTELKDAHYRRGRMLLQVITTKFEGVQADLFL